MLFQDTLTKAHVSVPLHKLWETPDRSTINPLTPEFSGRLAI